MPSQLYHFDIKITGGNLENVPFFCVGLFLFFYKKNIVARPPRIDASLLINSGFVKKIKFCSFNQNHGYARKQVRCLL